MSQTNGVEIKSSPVAGRGVFATKRSSPSDVLLSLDRPLIAVLERQALPDNCSWCFVPGPPDLELPYKSIRGTTGGLKGCGGCQRLKYCSKACQAKAWKATHKYECKVFKGLPHMFIELTWATYQIVKGVAREDPAMVELLQLETHSDEIERNKERRDYYNAMSYGAWNFSGQQLDLQKVMDICRRVSSNSFTLTTPTLDPIGLAIDPLVSRINHSCEPNAVIIFDGPKLEVRALEAFQPGDEILISYIDEHEPFGMRQARLKDRFYFTCTCTKCTLGASAPSERLDAPASALPPHIASGADQRYREFSREALPQFWPQHILGPSQHEKRLSAIQASGDRALLQEPDQSDDDAMQQLSATLTLLRESKIWPETRFPMPQLLDRYILLCTKTGDFGEALKAALKRYFVVDPVLYEQHWHPTRVVHTWILATLASSVCEGEEMMPHSDPVVAELKSKGVVLRTLYMALLMDVHDFVERSHGKNTMFAEIVEQPWRELMEAEAFLHANRPGRSRAAGRDEWHDQTRDIVRRAWPTIERVGKALQVPTRAEKLNRRPMA